MLTAGGAARIMDFGIAQRGRHDPHAGAALSGTPTYMARSTSRASRSRSSRRAHADGLGLRLGFHTSEAIEQEQDLFGYTVNVAARIAALARRDRSSRPSRPSKRCPNTCGAACGAWVRCRCAARAIRSKRTK